MVEKIRLDFLVLGAQKAGTTSLHDWLAQHSDIALPGIKETHFFSHEDRFKKGVNWYLSQFGSGNSENKLVGEVDPEYLFSSTAPERIKRFTDVNKFVVILRSPLDRAYSQYLMSVRRGVEELPFDKALADESSRIKSGGDFELDHQSYVSRSLYYEQIQRYFSVFPNGEFFFIKFDDFMDMKKGHDLYIRLTEFIGSSQDINFVNRANSKNQASIPKWSWLRDLIYRKGKRSLARRVVGALINDDLKLKLFLFLDKYNQKKLNRSDMNSAKDFHIDQEVVSKVLSDLGKVERITGLSLTDWKDSISRDFVKRKVS